MADDKEFRVNSSPAKIRCSIDKKQEARNAFRHDALSVMKLKNIILTLSLAAFAVGFSDLRENAIFWLGRPVGALLFGIYMILLVLEGATDLYDKQEAQKTTAPGIDKNSARTKKHSAKNPVLTTAPSH